MKLFILICLFPIVSFAHDQTPCEYQVNYLWDGPPPQDFKQKAEVRAICVPDSFWGRLMDNRFTDKLITEEFTMPYELSHSWKLPPGSTCTFRTKYIPPGPVFKVKVSDECDIEPIQ